MRTCNFRGSYSEGKYLYTGEFHYTPDAGFEGTDTFTYKASDGYVTSDAATIAVQVVNPNLEGTPMGEYYVNGYTYEGQPLNQPGYEVQPDPYLLPEPAGSLIGAPTSTGGWQYIDEGLVQAPQHGSVVINYSDGGYVYTPQPGYVGTDYFTVRVHSIDYYSKGEYVYLMSPAITVYPATTRLGSRMVSNQSRGYVIPLDTDDVNHDGIQDSGQPSVYPSIAQTLWASAFPVQKELGVVNQIPYIYGSRITLSYKTTGAGDIRVWEDDGTELLGDGVTSKSWLMTLDSMPSFLDGYDLTVEGVTPSSSDNDVSLTLSLEDPYCDETPYVLPPLNTPPAPTSQSSTVNITVSPPAQAAVDANRDGKVKLDGSDQTAWDKPYNFWLNNNIDRAVMNPEGGVDEDTLRPRSAVNDYLTGKINSFRDLTDYAPLQVKAPVAFVNAIETDNDTGWQVTTAFTKISKRPEIRLFPAVGNDMSYLTDLHTEIAQRDAKSLGVVGSDGSALVIDPSSYEGGKMDDTLNFLFEAGSAGEGELTFTFKKDGVAVATATVDLAFNDVQNLYEHWSPGGLPDTNTWGDLRNGAPPIPETADRIPKASGNYSNPTITPTPKDGHYILFVHGWRMKPWETISFANTAYKRLYWQGYQGGFGVFSWPTEYVNTHQWTTAAQDPTNFDRSEQKAWNSAPALRDLLTKLDTTYHGYQNVDLFAHSMGAIVAANALKLQADDPDTQNQKLVHSFVATQAAIAAEAFDAGETLTLYSHFVGTGKPFFANIGPAADKLVNFYNPQDYATNIGTFTWRADQATKPDNGYQRDGINKFRRTYFSPLGPELDPENPSDLYEIFAYAAAPGSLALGAQSDVGGPFLTHGGANDGKPDQLNLNTAFPTDSSKFTKAEWDHSAQFMSNNVDRQYYWNALLKAFGFTPGNNLWQDLQPDLTP